MTDDRVDAIGFFEGPLDDRERILEQLYEAAYIAAEMGWPREVLRWEVDCAVDVIEDVDTSTEVPS